MKVSSVFLAAALLILDLTFAADVAGSKDDPSLKRIEGSEILYYKTTKFDACNFALEKVQFDYSAQGFKETKMLRAEGPHTTIYYKLPPETTTLEGIRQYEAELKAKGYERLFEAAGDALTMGTTGLWREFFPRSRDTSLYTMSMSLTMTTRDMPFHECPVISPTASAGCNLRVPKAWGLFL